MEHSEILQGLVSFVCRAFMVEESEFDKEESLIDQGVIDSLGLIEITGFMKNTWGLSIEENDLNRENFGSVYKMVQFVQSKQEHR